MQKISLYDYARICRRESTRTCEVKSGDLVRIDSVFDQRGAIMGIVVSVNETNMCLIVDNQLEWWSRFVSCEVL